VLVGPLARVLDGADLSSLVGLVAGAGVYVPLTARSRSALRGRGGASAEGAARAVTAMIVGGFA
jgi:hypothetical protein